MSSESNEVVAANFYKYEAQYFGFSAKGFIDFYYNQLISAWTKVVEEVLIPSILQGEKHNKTAIKSLRDKIVNRIFQYGKLHLVLKKAQVPACVTLPSDRLNLELRQYDEEELLAKIERFQKEILKMRYELKYIEVQQKDASRTLALCELLQKSGIKI